MPPQSLGFQTKAAGLIGLGMALILVKLGNPIIFVQMEVPPADFWEFVLTTWPVAWGYVVLAAMILISLPGLSLKSIQPKWILWLPIAWVFWTLLSYKNSVAPDLSRLTIRHFGACTLMFFMGVFVLGRLPSQHHFFRAILFALLFIFWMGLDQHNGGLDATRKAFYELPNWQDFPKEYQLKIQSNRIFATFVYPNAFAGAILLWVPAITVILWEWAARVPRLLQRVVVGFFAYAALACLYWTGSKAGWLIAVAMLAVGLLHLQIKRPIRITIVAAVLILGLAGFAFKYRSYFEKGATSASARFIYWQAALKIANANPILGAGPGTFAKTFSPIKPPEAEMARLTHNDYLEQACDSGWPAFVLFSAFIGSAIVLAHRAVSKSPLHFAVWLGVFGWVLQSFVEFGLYIPAIGWGAFLLLGWLLSGRIAIDTPKPAR